MIKYLDFGMGILLKAFLAFLNNDYFVLNFWSNKKAILWPNKQDNIWIKQLPLKIRGFTIQEIPVTKKRLKWVLKFNIPKKIRASVTSNTHEYYSQLKDYQLDANTISLQLFIDETPF